MSTGVRLPLLIPILLVMLEVSAHPVVRVYPDGWCIVSQVIESGNVTRVPLLGEPDMMLVTDDMGVVDYNLSDGYVVVKDYAGTLNVTYETPELTSKEGKVWTLSLSRDIGEVEVMLPKNVEIVGMSDLPLKIEDTDEGLKLLVKTPFQLDYVILNRSESSRSNDVLVFVGLLVLTLIVAIGYVTLRKGKKLDLDDLDLSILASLESGEKLVSDIRRELEVPKSTLWRRINRLEAESLLKVKRRDQGSIVRLTRRGRKALNSTT